MQLFRVRSSLSGNDTKLQIGQPRERVFFLLARASKPFLVLFPIRCPRAIGASRGLFLSSCSRFRFPLYAHVLRTLNESN